MDVCGALKDRHQNIGDGHIGVDPFKEREHLDALEFLTQLNVGQPFLFRRIKFLHLLLAEIKRFATRLKVQKTDQN
jgi:hypothetical protein